jgi:hypothetical protein
LRISPTVTAKQQQNKRASEKTTRPHEPEVFFLDRASISIRRAASYTTTLRHCHRYSCSLADDLRWGSTPNTSPVTCARDAAHTGNTAYTYRHTQYSAYTVHSVSTEHANTTPESILVCAREQRASHVTHTHQQTGPRHAPHTPHPSDRLQPVRPPVEELCQQPAPHTLGPW